MAALALLVWSRAIAVIEFRHGGKVRVDGNSSGVGFHQRGSLFRPFVLALGNGMAKKTGAGDGYRAVFVPEKQVSVYNVPMPPNMMPSGKAGVPSVWIMLLFGRG